MNLKEIIWNKQMQIPVADWDAVFVFLFGSRINFYVSIEHYEVTAKPCKYNLKNIEQKEI